MFVDREKIEADAKAQWQRDASVRAQFQCLEDFQAYQVARARGLVHIMGERRPEDRT